MNVPLKRPSRGKRSSFKATDAELRPYGYAAGTLKRWCAACEREQKNLGPGAFKCRPCAELQFADVEALCETRFGGKK